MVTSKKDNKQLIIWIASFISLIKTQLIGTPLKTKKKFMPSSLKSWISGKLQVKFLSNRILKGKTFLQLKIILMYVTRRLKLKFIAHPRTKIFFNKRLNSIHSNKLDSQSFIWNGSRTTNLFLLEEMVNYFTINFILQAIQLAVKFLSNAQYKNRKNWRKCKRLRLKVNLVLIQV